MTSVTVSIVSTSRDVGELTDLERIFEANALPVQARTEIGGSKGGEHIAELIITGVLTRSSLSAACRVFKMWLDRPRTSYVQVCSASDGGPSKTQTYDLSGVNPSEVTAILSKVAGAIESGNDATTE